VYIRVSFFLLMKVSCALTSLAMWMSTYITGHRTGYFWRYFYREGEP